MKFDSTCEEFYARMSAYIDDDLPSSDAADLSIHLAGCDQCQARLDGYERVVQRAATLEDRPLPQDLWAGIAERIGASVPQEKPDANRFSPIRHRMPQLLAAGLIALVVGGGIQTFQPGNQPGFSPDVVPIAMELPGVANTTGFEGAIADLIRSLEESKPLLDARTIQVIEANLAVMDQALARATQALAADPDSDFLRRHLTRTSRQKLEMLQRVTTLTSAD